MKSFIYSVIISLSFSGLTAQEVLSTTSLADPNHISFIIEHGNYAIDTNHEREQYIGLWRFEENGLLFELKVEAVDQLLQQSADGSRYYFWDAVVLKYRLVENGTELYNNLDADTPFNYPSIGVKQGDREFLSGRIKDYTRNVTGTFSIRNLNGSPQRILFTLHRTMYTLHNPPDYYQDGNQLFSIPMNGIEMIKVE